MRLVIGILLSFAMMASAHSASRTEFDQLVQQLQAKPSDNALRERVIKMALELKPAPAIPEEARRTFVSGGAIAKAAEDVSGQKLAIKKFKSALSIAPWWGEAYFNLASIQVLAGDFDAAKASLQFYILTSPGEKEARDAQDRIYEIEGKAELAKAKKPSVVAKGPAPHAAAPSAPTAASLDGAIFLWRHDSGINGMQESTISIQGAVARVTYVNSLWQQQGRPPLVFQCTLLERRCDFGVIDSDESIGLTIRAELSVLLDGQAAVWKTTTNGGVTEERVHQVLR